MVIMVNGVALSEPVGSLAWLDRQHPAVVKLGTGQLAPEKTREVTARGSLYVSVREFGVVRQQDSKVNIIGTDNLTNNVAIILKNTGQLKKNIEVFLFNTFWFDFLEHDIDMNIQLLSFMTYPIRAMTFINTDYRLVKKYKSKHHYPNLKLSMRPFSLK